MGEQLEVQNKQEQIKSSITEAKQDKVNKFVEKLKNTDKKTDKTKEITDIFIDYADEVLEWIKKNMITNFSKIDVDWKNKLSTYEEAKQAFDTDINSLLTLNNPETNTTTAENTPKKISKETQKLSKLLELTSDIGSLIQLKKLESWKEITDFDRGKLSFFVGRLNLENDMKPITNTATTREKLINDKDASIRSEKNKTETEKKEIEENKTKAKEALNTNRTPETAKNFFERKENENVFNATFDEIIKIQQDKLDTYTDQDNIKTTKIKNFVNLINIYTKSTTEKPTTNISLKIADENSVYPIWTNIVTYTNEWKDKEITFWSQDDMQSRKAEKFDISKVDLSIPNPLTQFDWKGNYKSLEKYIKANPKKFDDNFKNIIDSILVYTNKTTESTDKYEDLNELKNGYANVITEYIVANPQLINRYQSYLTKTNMDILWGDKTTRIANYNKLVPIRKNNRENMRAEEKQQILDMGKAIGIQEKMTVQETLSKGLDSLIDQFGPMLVGVLKLLGFDKWSLLNMFGNSPEAKAKIDKMFEKEYGLSEWAKKAIPKIISEYDKDNVLRNNNNNNNNEQLPTAKQLKNSFINTDNSVTEYINKFITDEKHYQYINISVLQKWLNLYNKDQNEQININDIVTITTDNNNKQSITAINEEKKQIFIWAMTSIIDADNTRTEIANTNTKMNTDKENKKGEKIGNEQGLNSTERYSYLISNQQDIARYLTASLFSDKDLGYVMTENKLHNDNTPPPPPSVEVVVPTETLTFIDKDKNFTDGKLNAEGNKKTINEVIDVAKSPKNLQIIRGSTTIQIEQKTINNVITYGEIWKDNKVVIKTWDKIEEVSAEKSIADKRTEVKTELNKEATKTAKTAFESPTYTLDDKNIYQTQIAKISNLFAGDYNKLISETNQTTLKSLIEDNALDFKNMFTYRSLKQNDKDNTDTNYNSDKLDLSAATVLTSKTDTTIDLTKQKFTLKETATDKKINISVTKISTVANNTAKEWIITLVTDDKWKLTTKRTETTPAVVAAK